MDVRELAELRFPTGYVFENGTLFYEKLGDDRARGLLNALHAQGYRIVREREVRGRRLEADAA